MPHTIAWACLALLALAVAAFWPAYLVKPLAAVDRYTHWHALRGLLWFALLPAQPIAIARRRPVLHRLLGRAAPGRAVSTGFIALPVFAHAMWFVVAPPAPRFALATWFHALPLT